MRKALVPLLLAFGCLLAAVVLLPARLAGWVLPPSAIVADGYAGTLWRGIDLPLNARMFIHAAKQLIGGEKQLRWWQNRAHTVVTAAFVALLGIFAELLCAILKAVHVVEGDAALPEVVRRRLTLRKSFVEEAR